MSMLQNLRTMLNGEKMRLLDIKYERDYLQQRLSEVNAGEVEVLENIWKIEVLIEKEVARCSE